MTTLASYLPKILTSGKQILGSLISGITNQFGKLGTAVGKIGKTVIDGIKGLPKQMLSWGKDMMDGFIGGITDKISKLTNTVKGVGEKIKSFLHFSRPDEGPLREYETWMPDFVDGLSKTLKNASPHLLAQVKDLASGISDEMQINGSITTGDYSQNIAMQQSYNNDSLVNSFKLALSEMKIELDDEVAGHFVEKTVARAIYS